ncbi:MAG: response regulator [Desulfobacterales bacterium]|jgi:DNA-binding response OmpR family regulator
MKLYNLLIVDDEQRFADMLARRLKLRGCNCEVCYSGRDALEILELKNFHLILLDLHLPDIYGTEVLTRIRNSDEKTPVIIVTGHGTEKDRRECIQQGAYAFMHKPVGIDALMTILAEIGEMSA